MLLWILQVSTFCIIFAQGVRYACALLDVRLVLGLRLGRGLAGKISKKQKIKLIDAMIKRIFLALVAMLPVAATASVGIANAADDAPAQQSATTEAAAPAPMKMATVNVQELFDAMPDKATAEASLKNASEKYQAEYKTIQDEFNKKYADYQALANDAATPQTIKERRMQELQENDQKIQSFQRQAQTDLDELRKNLTAPIYTKIQKAIEVVGAEEGFTYIIDTSDNRVVFRGAGAIDVTAKVKAKLGLQ